MLRRRLKFKTVAIVTVCTLVILAGLAVGTVRLIDATLPGYRAELAEWVGDKLNQPLHIGGMELVWRWRGPSLRLTDVALLTKQGKPTGLRVDALALRFTFSDLLHGKTMPHSVALFGLDLTVVQTADGGFRLQNLADTGPGKFHLDAVAERLQQIEKIRIIESKLRIKLNALKAPVVLTNVTLSLTNKGTRHDLTGHARIASRHGKRIAFQTTILGDLARLSATSGHSHISAQGLAGTRLLWLAGMQTSALRGGRIDLDLWADWNARGFIGARTEIHVDAFSTVVANGTVATITPPITLAATARSANGAIRIKLDKLASDAFTGSGASGTLTVKPESGHVHGEFSALPAGLVAAGLHLWRPESLRRVATTGRLTQVTFERTPEEGWRLRAAFTQLRIVELRRGIEAGTFKGALTLSDQGGILQLDTQDAGLSWRGYINGRLPLDVLSGAISWQQTNDGRRVKLTDLRLVSAKTTVTGGGTLHLPKQDSPVADLRFEVQSDNVALLLDYLPQTNDMPFDRLRDWLPDAILSGRIDSGHVRIQGKLKRLPFDHGAGTFRVALEGSGVNLDYKPGSGWPVLHDIQGTLTLSGDTLEIRGEKASMLGVALDSAHVHVDNVREPVLKVTGHVERAGAAAMLDFLPHSPLEQKFGRLATVLEVSGPAGLTLKMSIPLKPDLGEITVDGRIHLAGVMLDHEVLPQPIRNIRGVVRFDRDGLYADGLQGQFLGMPVTATLKPAAVKSGDSAALAIKATARMQLPSDAAHLDELLPGPLLERVSGKATWQVSLRVSPTGETSGLRVTSDLEDLALDLPAPLGKPTGVAVPLTVTLSADRSHIRLRYGERMFVEARRADDELQAVDVVFGGVDVTPPSGTGVWVGGKLPVVRIDAWRNLINAFGTDGASELQFRGANVEVAGVRLGNRRIGPMSIEVLPLIEADGWLATIDGKGAAGSIRWLGTGARAQINARFDHVSLHTIDDTRPTPNGNDNEPAATNGNDVIDPASLPAMALSIANLRVNGTKLGRLHVEAEAIKHGLALNDLRLTSPGLSVSATGRWLRENGKSSASFKGQLSGGDLGQVLAVFGFSELIKAQSTHIKANLHFAPRPSGLQIGALNGEVHLEMHDGVLMMVDSDAAQVVLGVLGLLNLHALPRRLQLDFRDVVSGGLAFDTIKGDFRINSGVVYTENLVIETPAATIYVEGSIDLAAKRYNQHVTIEPKISSAATIAGTVLGGPVFGLVVYLVQDLLDEPLSDIAAVSYYLTGSWSNPVIKSLEAK